MVSIFTDLELQPQLVAMLRQVLQVREASIITALQELLGNYRLRLDINDLLPVFGIDLARRGGHKVERPGTLDIPPNKKREALGGVDEGRDRKER